MRKTNKKMIALILVLILIASFIPFKVFADGTYNYTITFTVADGTDHTIAANMNNNEARPGELIIDNTNYVELRDGTGNNANIINGVVSVANNGKSATITVTDGPAGFLRYGGNAYSLVSNNNNVSCETAISTDMAISVQNFVSQQQGGNQGGNNQNESIEVQFDNATRNGNVITFTDDSTNPATVVTATVAPVEEGKATWNGNNLMIVSSEVNNVIFTLGDTFDSSKMDVKIIGNNNYNQVLAVNGNKEVNLGGLNLPSGGIHFGIEMKSNGNNNQGEGQNQGGNNNEPQFDGNAYFVWLDSNNQICYHKFTGLYGRPENPNDGYKINYINVSELTDQSANNSAYVWGQDNANWVLAGDMEDDHGDVRTDLTKAYIFGNGNDDMGVQLNPTGARNGENSIWSNGDRNFRVAIYRDNYNAIEFSSNQNDYTYFPCFWDQTFFTSTVDISGTTKEKPAEYDTYLLESTIRFTKGQFSAPVTAVEALDVNPNAVDIRIVDGTCTIKFNSNYYDNVIFKITAGGKDYFVKVNRLVLDIKDNFGPTTTNPCLIARIFYDTSKSYDDFEVVATVIYNNGNTETKVLTPEKLRYYDSDDHNRDIQGNEYALNGGKGLYESQCYVEVDKNNLVGAYFTIVKKGSLTAEGDTYNGTFSGSGEGTYYNAATRDIVL